jgi:hypothetical protein
LVTVILGVVTIGVGIQIIRRGMPNQWAARHVPPLSMALFGKTMAMVVVATLALAALPLGLYGRALFALRSHTSVCADLWTADEIRSASGGAALETPRDDGFACTMHALDGGHDVARVELRKDKSGLETHARFLVHDYGSLPKKPAPPELGATALRFETERQVVVAWQRGPVMAFVSLDRRRFSDVAIAEIGRMLAQRDDVLRRFE